MNNTIICTIIDKLLNASQLSNVQKIGVKMATFGTQTEFSGIESDCSSYNERCTFYLIGTKIYDNDIKRVIFLSSVGHKTYQLIRGSLPPNELSDFNYDDIITTMTNHYHKKNYAIAERFKFNKCNMKTSQALFLQFQQML